GTDDASVLVALRKNRDDFFLHRQDGAAIGEAIQPVVGPKTFEDKIVDRLRQGQVNIAARGPCRSDGCCRCGGCCLRDGCCGCGGRNNKWSNSCAPERTTQGKGQRKRKGFHVPEPTPAATAAGPTD